MIEAVLFFDGKNIPLTYFIEGCEEAKSMFPAEAESHSQKLLELELWAKSAKQHSRF